MAFTISATTFSTTPISLHDAIQEIKTRVRANEAESLREAAPFLYALGQNKTFLIDALMNEIRKSGEIETGGVQDTSLVLYQDATLLIRANLWLPPNRFPAAYNSRVSSMGYLIPHNHDFNFLTMGYWGTGYCTTIYECDLDRSVLLSPGDHVDLRFSEKTVLHEGKLMLYRALRDVHFQDHPTDFSVSLNVVLLPPSSYAGQYLFDIRNQRVKAVLDWSRSQILVCKLAAAVRDPGLLDELRSLEMRSVDHRVAAAASSAIATILRLERGI